MPQPTNPGNSGNAPGQQQTPPGQANKPPKTSGKPMKPIADPAANLPANASAAQKQAARIAGLTPKSKADHDTKRAAYVADFLAQIGQV